MRSRGYGGYAGEYTQNAGTERGGAEMPVTAIIGDVLKAYGRIGNGKTCAMTMLLHTEACSGEQVYANYTLKFPGYNPISVLEKDNSLDFASIPSYSVVGVDEFPEYASAYKGFPQTITRLAQQHRKKHMKIFYTAQVLGHVHKAFRMYTDKIFFVEKYYKYGKNLIRCTDGDCRKEKHDHWFQIVDYELGRGTLFRGADVYPLYNSDEIIEWNRKN
jgi:hypothetical protein